MEFELFTYPNCARCDALKTVLRETGLPGREHDLTRRDGKIRIREFLKVLKRDDTGAIIIPTLVVKREGAVAAVLNTGEELSDWLTSKG